MLEEIEKSGQGKAGAVYFGYGDKDLLCGAGQMYFFKFKFFDKR